MVGMRLPLELYLYVGKELLRLFLLTAFVLVWIIAFAAAVKPISEGQLSVTDTVRYLSLAVVPMVPFAAPFAAGFAATLSYHRLASDNELLACTASGVSPRSILAPVLVLGGVLTIGLMLVSHQLVPGVMRQMERMLQADVGTMLVTAINRGDGVRFEGLSIYADKAISYGPSEESGAFDEIELLGMAISDTAKEGQAPKVSTARRALAQLFEQAEGTIVAVTLYDAAGMLEEDRGEEERRGLVWLEWAQESWLIPSRLKHDPKFETWQGLGELYRDPDRFPEIYELGLEMAQALGRWEITRELRFELRRDQKAVLVSADGVTFHILGSDIAWTDRGPVIQPLPPTEPEGAGLVRVQRYEADGRVMQYEAASAVLKPGHYEVARERGTFVNLEMEGVVVVRDLSQTDDRNELEGYDWQKLHLPRERDPSEEFLSRTSEELLVEAADPKYDGDQYIRPHAAALEDEIAHLRREIISKHHERAALSLSCLVMLFTGAVMAIRLRTAIPLVVYMWSFLPALGTVILISSGQQVMESQSVFGGAWLLWSGIAALGLMGLTVFSQVRKH
jgi:lipopolysaccharide export system permease protein